MKINISKEWLKASADDLKIISNIIHVEDLTHMVAFHSHQSIEKSIKSFIEYKNGKVPKQHDLLRLSEYTGEDLKFNNDDLFDTLNGLYIDSRYPGDMGLLPYGKPTVDDAKEFYNFAQEVFNKVCTILNINIYEVKNS